MLKLSLYFHNLFSCFDIFVAYSIGYDNIIGLQLTLSSSFQYLDFKFFPSSLWSLKILHGALWDRFWLFNVCHNGSNVRGWLRYGANSGNISLRMSPINQICNCQMRSRENKTLSQTCVWVWQGSEQTPGCLTPSVCPHQKFQHMLYIRQYTFFTSL